MAMEFSPRLLKHQVGVNEEVKRILDFLTKPKDVSIDAIVKTLHKATNIQQKIKDELEDFDIDVIIIDDPTDVNSTLEYLQKRQKSDEDVLAYVSLYIHDETKNTVWLKCDFPCPVVFDFCMKKTVHVTHHSAIENACKEEFSLGAATVRKRIAKISDYLNNYASDLRKVISIFEDEEQINEFVIEAFDEYTDEEILKRFACSVELCGSPYTPYLLRNAFAVKAYKSQLVNAILEDVCKNISNSVREKLWINMLKQLDMRAFVDVKFDVSGNPVGELTLIGVFVWIFDIVWNEIVLLFSAVFTLFMREDINSETWREPIATATYTALKKRKTDIVKKISKQCQDKCKHAVNKIEEEIRKTRKIPNSAKRNPGCKMTAVSYGTDNKSGKKVVALRAENFDHIHLSHEKDMDIVFDQKTIKESTKEMQEIDTYIDRQAVVNVRISFDRRRYLNQIVRKHTPELMEKHSNLITISTSPVTSHRGGIEKAACIVIYCSCKGIIPLGEPEFPRELDNIPVDVREGYIYFATAREFHDPLRLGCSIGPSGFKKAGSIGVFVKEVDTANQYGLLTCSHVLLSLQEFTDPHIRQKIRESAVPTDVVQPSLCDDLSNITCGRLIDAKYGNVDFQNNDTGVDCAYVKMTSRIPQAPMNDGYTEDLKMGPPILDMDVYDTRQTVRKFGRTTELTEGEFDSSGAFFQPRSVSGLNCQQENNKGCLKNLYKITGKQGPFLQQGDSGASVYIESKTENMVHVIGLAVGGLCNGREFFVTPIGAVLDYIDPRIEILRFPN